MLPKYSAYGSWPASGKELNCFYFININIYIYLLGEIDIVNINNLIFWTRSKY